jgi:hypothetical protein
MNITLELTDEESARLAVLARTQGGDPSRVAHDLLAADLLTAASPIEDRTLELLSQWAEEDDTDDSEELQRRDIETEEFMAAVEADRLTLSVPNIR